MKKSRLFGAAALVTGALLAAPVASASGPSDAEIAHIAYTAGALDVAAAKQALAKASDAKVRSFAEVMVRDHEAVNKAALALVTKLKVKPADNAVSKALAKQAAEAEARLARLAGGEFDRAYVQNEAAYHRSVNGALRDTLIPSADNGELKALLEKGLALFGEHQAHAEQLAKSLK